MADLGDGDNDRGLWQRWRHLAASEVPAPNALTLAAYAEGRLSEEEAESVENWLATYPEALTEVLAARAVPQSPEIAPERLIEAASALVPEKLGENVVLLRRPAHGAPQWRNAIAWSSVAASLIAASFVGFSLGSDAYQKLSPSQSGESAYADALEVSPSLESLFGEDSGT